LPPPPDADEAAREVRAAAAAARSQFSALSTPVPVARERFRAGVARIILVGYMAVIGLATLYLLYRGVVLDEAVFPDLMELLKVAVIPIVTFVIGHYFGSGEGR
jgi:hypothetical protein